MKFASLVFALCLVSPSLFAQAGTIDPQYRVICRETLTKSFTPPAPDPALKPDCDSAASYYGIGRPVDYEAARACAFEELAEPQENHLSLFAGPGVLSMVYANGQGVTADFELATRFACLNSWSSPAETEAHLDLFAEAKDSGHLGHFDLCDNATSRNSEGACASIEARLSDIDRKQKMDAIRTSLANGAIPGFDALVIAERDFEDSYIANEMNTAGMARPAMYYEELNDLRDQFLADLQRVTSPGLHEGIPLKKADKTLSKTFRPFRIGAAKAVLPKAPKGFANSTVTFKGVEESQRVWLPLREAWMAFASAENSAPHAADQAGAIVTLQRVEQLNVLTQITEQPNSERIGLRPIVKNR
jgi:hypothetical protein